MQTGTIDINGIKLLVKVHHENRKNSRVSVGQKEINIRIPISLTREDMFKQIQEMKLWAIKRVEGNIDRFKPRQHKEYNDGDILKFGNGEYKLRMVFKDKSYSSAKICGQEIHLAICAGLTKENQKKHISTLLSISIARIKHPMLVEKINSLNEKHFKQKVNKVRFKYNKSNWGSCSKTGNINISTRLLFAPDDVIEYICIHELAHLIELNHSDNFWNLVGNAMPGYKEKDQWLKDNGANCWF